MYRVIERFVSIDGEGPTSGELATFIRFEGCNLRCTWCDTEYSWNGECAYEEQTAEEIYDYIKASGARNVTLTGGEPLLQKNLFVLLDMLSEDPSLVIHIETNGAMDIAKYKERYRDSNIHFILDYKLPASGMHHTMKTGNFDLVGCEDVYKFVIASEEDLQTAYDVARRYDLMNKCLVYFSPVVESIEPKKLVEFMIEKQLNDVRLQIQVHKVIWPKDTRGV
ncbi:MAG: putative 7-carboxy-7-deazaguanine synthase QueE [Bacillus sp. (in: firmicutes)]